MPSLGEFVHRKRIQRGWTQKTLAATVGVSYSYMQKIEQNDLGGSLGETVLTRLIDVLLLTPGEANHLRVLGGFEGAQFANARAAPDTVQMLLETFVPHPAARYGDWRILAVNRSFELLWPGMAAAPSMLDWLLGDCRARAAIPDWHAEVRLMVAMFRAYAADPDPIRRDTAQTLLERLWRWPEFREAWNSGLVMHGRDGRPRRVRVNGLGVETSIREILMPWPQQGARFQALFIGLIEQNAWAVEELLRRKYQNPGGRSGLSG